MRPGHVNIANVYCLQSQEAEDLAEVLCLLKVCERTTFIESDIYQHKVESSQAEHSAVEEGVFRLCVDSIIS